MNELTHLDRLHKEAGMLYYALKDEQLIEVPCSVRAARGEKTKQMNQHIIKKDFITDDLLLSTIFVGMRNTIFETMIFKRWADGDIYGSGEIIARPASYEEAIEFHTQTLQELKLKLAAEK